MSGLGIATVVVEAGEHSDARAQGRRAMAHGRPVLLTRSVIDTTRWGRELADGTRLNVFPGCPGSDRVDIQRRSPRPDPVTATGVAAPSSLSSGGLLVGRLFDGDLDWDVQQARHWGIEVDGGCLGLQGDDK